MAPRWLVRPNRVVLGALLFAACAPSGSGSSVGTGSGGAHGTGGSGSATNSGGTSGTGGTSAGSGGGQGSGGRVASGSGGLGQATGGAGAGSGGADSSGGSSGGANGTGGSAPGSGGSSGSGGSAGAGGDGSGITDVSTFKTASCTITPTVTTATKIPMVGIATFTTDLAGAERALIQFGKTTTYTLEAPVNWSDPMHRTLLLGMPSNTTVHYRVVVIAGGTACIKDDATYKTGAPPAGAPADLTPMKGPSPVSPAPGFIIAQDTSWAYVIDNGGAVVWAYKFPIMLTRARMSWDGAYMFARDAGPFDAATGGSIYRVAMDGTGEMKLTLMGGTHHDLTVIPTGIAYPAKKAAGGCDSIYTAAVDGSNNKELIDLDVVFSKFTVGPMAMAKERCHVNFIHYYKDTDSYSVSDREKDALAFISGTGELLGSIGATPTSATPNHIKAEGADSTATSLWRVQHGHDLYAPNKLVLWSNGVLRSGTSHVLHYTITGATAKLDWSYAGAGTSGTLSDAQHLSNGNFLLTNSDNELVQEIDPDQKVVQSFTPLSHGYSMHRPTLYGPPPGR